MEEKLFKIWNIILSASDLEVRPGLSYITLRSKETCTTSLYVYEDKSVFEATKIKLKFGFGGAEIVAEIKPGHEYYDQAMETLERTKLKCELENKKQLEIDRRKYIDELNSVINRANEKDILN